MIHIHGLRKAYGAHVVLAGIAVAQAVSADA